MRYFQNVSPAERNLDLVERGGGEEVISASDTVDRNYQPPIALFVIAKEPSSSQMYNVISETSTLLLPYPYLS